MKKLKIFLTAVGFITLWAATSTYENGNMSDIAYVLQSIAGLEMAVTGYLLPEGGKSKWEG